MDGKVCTNCADLDCADCSNTYECSACKAGFYLSSGKCVYAECKVQRCSTCEADSHEVCNVCESGFSLDSDGLCQSTSCKVKNCDDCRLSGEAACDKCFDGFAFNRATLLCEDASCKKDNCLKCEESGIWAGCDVCDFGYYFDQETSECTKEDDCEVRSCVKCPTDASDCK